MARRAWADPCRLCKVPSEGTGWAYGATAGVTLTPTPTTTIGLGWRSALNQKIEGNTDDRMLSLPGTTIGSVTTTVDLPDIVSLGIRQRLDPRWTAAWHGGMVELESYRHLELSSAERGAGDGAR